MHARSGGPRRAPAVALAAFLLAAPAGCTDSKSHPIHLPPRPQAAAPSPGGDPKQIKADSPQHLIIYDP